jgi:hypothetical protein
MERTGQPFVPVAVTFTQRSYCPGGIILVVSLTVESFFPYFKEVVMVAKKKKKPAKKRAGTAKKGAKKRR